MLFLGALPDNSQSQAFTGILTMFDPVKNLKDFFLTFLCYADSIVFNTINTIPFDPYRSMDGPNIKQNRSGFSR
jgi:hypothetical protein